MRRDREPIVFALTFFVASTAIGWVVWSSSFSVGGFSLDQGMLVVPVVSAMLSARGFPWKRKLLYAAATLATHLLVGITAGSTGFHALAARELNAGTRFPSWATMLYLAFLTVFPVAMLILFVGRHPALLWSKRED